MDFNTVYAQKLTTADRVAALVKDDDWDTWTSPI